MTTTASVQTRTRPLSRPATLSSSDRSPSSQAPSALLTLSGLTLAGAFFTMIYLHSVSVAELSPVSTTVSDLIFVDGLGWLFGVSTMLLAVASIALTIALARTRLPGGRLITVVLSLWSLGLVVAAAFPTDPIDMATISLVGEIHRYAGATMYASLPVAGWLVYRRSATSPTWAPYRGAIRILSISGALLGVLFTLSHAPKLFPDSPLAGLFNGLLIHGLVERVLILSLFGLLLAIGLGLARAGQPTAHSREVAP